MGGEFLDTNIIVYAHDSDAGRKHEVARDLVLRLLDERAGLLSVQVLQEFFVTVTKKIPVPLDQDTAAEIVEDLGTLTVFSPDVQDVLGAIRIAKGHQISFWDAMIVRAALALDATVIWSEDFAAGVDYDGAKARNPFT